MGTRAADSQPVAAIVGANVAKLRAWRHMSLRDLSARTRRAGHLINPDSLNQIEAGVNRFGMARGVTVDQLAVLAAVFRVNPLALMNPTFEPPVTPPRSASTRRPQNTPENGQNGA